VQAQALFRDPFKVIARNGHPRVGRRVSLKRYLELDHILIRIEDRDMGAVDRVLARTGKRRRIGLWVPHFVSAPLAVASSDMICTLASSVAYRARELLGVKILEPPITLPAPAISMFWPRAHNSDPARAWFRELIASGRAASPSVRRQMSQMSSDGPD